MSAFAQDTPQPEREPSQDALRHEPVPSAAPVNPRTDDVHSVEIIVED